MRIDEDLEDSAPLARTLARALCRPGADGRSCEWLHGFWPCLRILGLAADPGRHAAFYLDALRKADSPRPRILVSGAADASMLAHVLAAFRGREAPRISVVDTCETPLALNRHFAERIGARIETRRSSILDYATNEPFDLICTHSFFGMFSPAERPRLIEAWRRLLRPGGRVATAHPLRPFGPDEPNRFTPEQAHSFRASVAARANELGALLGTDAASVMAQVEAYLGARYGFPVRCAEELGALFEAGRFTLEHLETTPIAPGTAAEAGGPGLRNSRVRYAHIVAVGGQTGTDPI